MAYNETATLGFTVDGKGAEAGINSVKRSLSNLADTARSAGQTASTGLDSIGEGGTRAAQSLDRTTRNLISSIQRTTASMQAGSRSSSEYFRTLANQRGANVIALEPYLKQLDDVTAKQKKAQTAMAETDPVVQKLGISERQLAAAMRGVPAQLTDIVVSLQGGQRPLTVLLQQGGQLKDMFGGVVPAARALATQLMSMISPLTVAGTAVAGLTYLIREGTDQQDRISRSLIATGNAAGMTASQVIELGREVGSVTGQYGMAQDAVEALAASGKLTGEQIRTSLRGIVDGAQVTGQSVEKLVEQFEKVAEDPAEGIYKLNERYNFLTADIYKQIVALQKQGKTQEATQLAFETYSRAMSERMPQILENTGAIEQAWNNVKSVLIEVKNAIMDIGQSSVLEKQLAEANAALDDMYANYGAYSDDQRMAAQERIDRLKRQQAEERTAASATGERIRKETADIDKLYEAYKKKDSQKTDPEKSYYQSTSETIARQIEQLKLEAQQEGALTNAQKLRIQIENQAADSKKKLTAAHKEYLNKQLDELEALEKAASDRKFIKDYEKQYRDELDKTVKSYEDQIAVVGMSTEKAEMYRKELEIMRDARNRIDDAKAKGILPEGYDTKILEDARNQIDLMLQKQQELKDARNDPWLALKESLENYKESARDAGTQIRDMAQNTFQSMEDFFVKFATTGKLEFSDLVNSIIADIARMYAKKATASLFDFLFNMAGDSIASGFSSIFGSSGSGSSGVGFKYDASQFASNLEFRASGGPVSGKSAYIVGEQGPELFVPNTNGQIIPNNRLGAGSGISIRINQQNEGTPKQVSDTSADFDGKNLIIRIVTQDIQNDGMISRTMSKTFGMRRAAGAM